MKFNIPCLQKSNSSKLDQWPPVDLHQNASSITSNALPYNTITSDLLVKQSDDLFNKVYKTNTDYVQKCTVLGDEKELALLFLDIRNFTAFMEQRSPYDIIYVIRKLFVLFNDSIREAGGRIVETVGDSIYGVFGLKTDLKSAVKSSLDAARAIFHDLEVFNATYAQPYFNLSFEIGIGLHQGKVLVGQYDLDYNNHMTVMGLPVNIAARLQAETKELNNDLLMSEDAYRLLDEVPCDTKSTVTKLRGISQPIQVRLMGQSYHDTPHTDDMLDYYISMAG
jgi:adenylate cyclase